jgi:hypothetical protein
MNSNMKGILIASAVAGLVGCGNPPAAPAAPDVKAPTGATETKVKCIGLNECKAKGACAQAGHACGGKNECKGKGVTLVPTEAECTAKGGKKEG